MSIEYRDNVPRFVKALENRTSNAMKLARRGMELGMRDFETKVLREQMTGRNRGPFGSGLNRISRFLAGSTSVKVKPATGNDFVVQMAVGAKYARVHQGKKSGKTYKPFIINHPGTDNGFGRGIHIPPYKIKMPKRLYIPEDFVISGTELIMKQLTKAIKEF